MWVSEKPSLWKELYKRFFISNLKCCLSLDMFSKIHMKGGQGLNFQLSANRFFKFVAEYTLSLHTKQEWQSQWNVWTTSETVFTLCTRDLLHHTHSDTTHTINMSLYCPIQEQQCIIHVSKSCLQTKVSVCIYYLLKTAHMMNPLTNSFQ